MSNQGSLNDGRFWGVEQDKDLTPTIPRDVQIAAIGTLIERDALDLVPMLFGWMTGPTG